MNFRFYTVYLALLSFTEVVLGANNTAWNCEQGKNGEWSCLNQGPNSSSTPSNQAAQTPKPPLATPSPANETAPQPNATAKIKPELTAPADTTKTRVRMTENQKPVIEKVPTHAEPPATVTKQSGWSCNSGAEKANWNCNLVGPDPKGEARAIAESEPSSLWLTPTFTHQQERMFQALRGEFAQDPWQNCSNWSRKKTKQQPVSQDSRDNATTDVDADSSEIFDGDVMNFAGNVDLRRADQHLSADKASYDTVAETMDAQGNVIYSESQIALSSDTASMSLSKDEARLRRAQFIIAEAPLRGSAETVYRDNPSLSRFHDATFTSCAPGNQDWIAHASRVKINRDTGLGSAKNAWLEFKGVPVVYTPYISFPVDDRRVSGLLAPTWGSTQRNGFDVSAPVYLNLATNFDDTITPRYMAKRGGMLRNKFRYLTDYSEGTLGAEIVPYDQLKDKQRYSINFKDRSVFSEHLSSTINVNKVSDKEYLNDLNNALGFQTNRFLPTTAYVNYGRPDVNFSAGIQNYQSVDKTIASENMPYDILPRVNFKLGHDFDNLPISLALDNQFTDFRHDASGMSFNNSQGNAISRVNGQRINIAPSISLPLESSAGFITPKITGQFTHYQLSDQTSQDIALGQANNISRTLPVFSVDSGMMFEKALNLGNSSYTHTLEPRAFYLYIPRKDQTNIPLFDTTAYDTNFYSLFRENRYTGIDRIQDANQITLAGTSRFIDSRTGLEPARLSLGQIIYFQDRSVDLDYLYDTRHPTTSTSNFIGELSGQISRDLSYSTGAQWDPEENGFSRTQTGLRYRNDANEILDVGYRYRRTPSENSDLPQTRQISQSDVSFRWPLFNNWYGLGRWQYSFNFGKTTESFIGLEKENCCWRLRLLGRRYINGANNANSFTNLDDAKPETAFFVQLELKGLTNFGDNVDQFLNRNLKGYREANYFDD